MLSERPQRVAAAQGQPVSSAAARAQFTVERGGACANTILLP
jgi:hypothetical protein